MENKVWILSLQQITEKCMNMRNKHYFICIGLEKACDKVDRLE